MAIDKRIKDPSAVIDYSIDWASKWLPEGDTVNTSEWFVPTGITLVRDSLADGVATVWLSGGVVGQTYHVVNRITTGVGRLTDRTLEVEVRQR